MNKILLVVTVLLLSNCKKEAEPSPFWGTASVVMNGQAWLPSGWSVKVAGGKQLYDSPYNELPCDPAIVGLQFHKQNPEGHLREKFSIGKVIPQVGTYPIRVLQDCKVSTAVGADYHLLGADGDVLLDSYKVLEGENNFIEVTSYDAATGEIKGNFNITFVFNTESDSKKHVQDIPDTVRFTNGQFHTKIIARGR